MKNRRSFLKQASLASTPFLLPSRIWAAKGDEAPNNRINIAVIGVGKWGRSHTHKLIRNPEFKSLALPRFQICEPSTPKN